MSVLTLADMIFSQGICSFLAAQNIAVVTAGGIRQ